MRMNLLLSTDAAADPGDIVLGSVCWASVGSWGYLSQPLGGALPSVPSGSYFILAALAGGPDASSWNDAYVLESVFVDADLDGDGYDQMVDCDDHDPSVHPGAPELCNGKDDDCDGLLSPGERDDDGDGWMVCAGDRERRAARALPAAR